ncbi:MAG: hypothetical protein ACOX6W_00630 [Lentisphaeria bacterium]
MINWSSKNQFSLTVGKMLREFSDADFAATSHVFFPKRQPVAPILNL